MARRTGLPLAHDLVQADVATPDVVAVTPAVAGPGMVVRGNATRSVSITGMEPECCLRVIALADKMVAARRAARLDPADAIRG